MPDAPSAAATKNCFIVGITARAVAPRQSGWIGRSRQPSTIRPSSTTMSSIAASAFSSAIVSVGRNAMPAAYGTLGREREPDDRAQELVGHLEQDAGAVAGVGLGPGGAAVGQVASAPAARSSRVVRPHAAACGRRTRHHRSHVRSAGRRGPWAQALSASLADFHETRSCGGARDDAGPDGRVMLRDRAADRKDDPMST